MKILFLTIARITEVSSRHIYKDLMRKFRDEGHEVFIACPNERRYKEPTKLNKSDKVSFLSIKTLNIQKTNFLEKGLAIFLLEYQFLRAIKKYFNDTNFDLILFSTPPITFTSIIKYLKSKSGAKAYLLLKDIFPQNAVDLEIFNKGSMLHRYYLRKEKSLYSVSDFIGCMSPANVEFIRKNNPEIDPQIVEVNPNSIEPIDINVSKEEINGIRNKYQIPLDVTVYIYGGNLGKPQGIDFLIETLNYHKNNINIFFAIVGSGTEFRKLKNWNDSEKPVNTLLLSKLPKKEYDLFIRACDVGLIFLDKNFTIPNFPSRLLTYMENKMPVIAATDRNTDLGKIMEDNQFGLWSESGDIKTINENLQKLTLNHELCKTMGHNGYNYLLANYTVTISYQIIMKHFHS